MTENQALDLKAIQQDRAKTLPGYKFVTFAEMAATPPAKRWLIKGIIARGETSAWIAPPKAMKSALLAEAAVCVATGTDWHGYRSKATAGVVYFAIERADLVEKRLVAHRQQRGLKDAPIVVCREAIDLTKPEAFKNVIDTIRSVKETLRTEIGMIIVDTFAKLIAGGGGDENSAKDQAAIFVNLQRVKNNTGVHVALIGHTGKDESRGARGSNALLGDVDVMVCLSGDDIKTATVTGANDIAHGPLFSFRSQIHEFGVDEDGDPNSVHIVSNEEVSAQVAPRPEKRLSETQEAMYRLLRDAGQAGLSTDDWNDKAREIGIGVKRRATLHNVRSQLRDKGLAHEYAGIWRANTNG